MKRACLLRVLGLSAAPAGHLGHVVAQRGAGPFRIFAQHQQDDYSANWLSRPLLPGESRAMTFDSDAHACLIHHKMRFAGGAVRIGAVDICQATTLVVGDDGRVTFSMD